MRPKDIDKDYAEADKLFEAGSYSQAYSYFLKLAQSGDGKSMSRLALIYAEGLGVEKNLDESIMWDMRAIEIGDITSLGNLALTFCGKREYRKARYWFERAVAAGDGDAALELANLLYVSDKEVEEVRKLVGFALRCESITPSSREEAEQFLQLLL